MSGDWGQKRGESVLWKECEESNGEKITIDKPLRRFCFFYKNNTRNYTNDLKNVSKKVITMTITFNPGVEKNEDLK